MSTRINLSNITHGKSYEIEGFVSETSAYAEKLYKMGFVKGTPIELAPVKISDPLVVQVRGSRVALRKSEAEEILVREITHA